MPFRIDSTFYYVFVEQKWCFGALNGVHFGVKCPQSGQKWSKSDPKVNKNGARSEVRNKWLNICPKKRFGAGLARFWAPFWEPKWLKMEPKTCLKSEHDFGHVFDAEMETFWTPKRSKLSQTSVQNRKHTTAEFDYPFSVVARFWGWQGVKTTPKSPPKRV